MAAPPVESAAYIICAHCSRMDVGTARAGIAWVLTRAGEQVAVCAPRKSGRPVCDRLVTIFKHQMPCPLCTRYFPPDGRFEAVRRAVKTVPLSAV